MERLSRDSSEIVSSKYRDFAHETPKNDELCAKISKTPILNCLLRLPKHYSLILTVAMLLSFQANSQPNGQLHNLFLLYRYIHRYALSQRYSPISSITDMLYRVNIIEYALICFFRVRMPASGSRSLWLLQVFRSLCQGPYRSPRAACNHRAVCRMLLLL